MQTFSLTSADGLGIVYDVVGEGSAIILLHGGGNGQSRQSWHQTGYVERLQNDYQVITMDIRGHGESDKPLDPTSYTINRLCQDILAVADECDVEQFALWGFSYGGNIVRYFATRTNRITKLIVKGTPFGAVGSDDFRRSVEEFRSYWEPIVQAILDGSREPASLSEDDQAAWQQMNIPVTLTWLLAMLDWGDNEPADLRCPTLWLSGSENENAIASMKEYEDRLEGTGVKVHIVEGIDHVGEFEEIDLVFPTMMDFTKD